MRIEFFKYHLFVLCFLLSAESNNAQGTVTERNTEVSMRMIGHEVLLSLGDSTTRVMPIEKVDGRYKISFASQIQFNPDDLVATIDQVVKEIKMAKIYLVEVEHVSSGEVVYAYRMGATLNLDDVACRSRDVLREHYCIWITILEADEAMWPLVSSQLGPTDNLNAEAGGEYYSKIALLMIALSILVACSLFFWNKGYRFKTDSGAIMIGEYLFDRRNMELCLQDEKTELTSKESDLLFLLHSYANATLEREVMLKVVWGDEGDYVGRTLDVFISKLRKKLEADPSVRIANIRGVGYKLILNND